MSLDMGKLRPTIKASPAPCSLIHFSGLLLLRNQVSVKPLLVLLIIPGLISMDFSATISSVLCQILGLLVAEEGSRFLTEGCWVCIEIASGLGPSL